MEKWRVLDSEYIIDNQPYNRTKRDRCLLPSGIEIDYYTQEYPNWVNAIVITPDMELVLVRQYRHGCGDFVLETSGGMVENGERSVDAIVREVKEETGFQSAGSPIFLGEFFANPATSNNKVSTYLFLNAKRIGEQCLDTTEDIEIELVPFATFGQMISKGQTKPIFSTMGYYLAKEYLACHAK